MFHLLLFDWTSNWLFSVESKLKGEKLKTINVTSFQFLSSEQEGVDVECFEKSNETKTTTDCSRFQ